MMETPIVIDGIIYSMTAGGSCGSDRRQKQARNLA